MASSHVPKFGDWDNDDLPYTTYFETARKEKGGKIMNPNDPEENPEAFMFMRGSNYDCQPVRVGFSVDPSKSYSRHQDGAGRNGSYDHQRSTRKQSNVAPESASENSSQKNGRPGGSSFSASVSGQSQRNGDYQFGGNKHQRTASVPKFGEWDETDPTSGEGFSVIFNQVKKEKQAPNFPAVVAPEVKTMNYSDSHHSKCPTPPSWSSKSKKCCCLF